MFHDVIPCGGRSNLYGLHLSQSSNLRVADNLPETGDSPPLDSRPYHGAVYLCTGRCNTMRIPAWLAPFLLLSLSAHGEVAQSLVPQTVEFASGKLHLKAYFWKPAGSGPFPAVLFNHGSGGADPDHTAGMPITQSANVLAPFF